MPAQRPRLVSRSPADRVRRANLHTRWWEDLYHEALLMSWPRFLLWGNALYFLVNGLFAELYLLQPGSIANARPGSFADAFFFSVQCISTIGFGTLSPATLYANLLVTAEAVLSLAIVALATGSVFARFSRPRARVMFARRAAIGNVDGVRTLQFRLANARTTQILSAEVQVHLLRFERTAEGDLFRRFYDLQLVRGRTPIFALTFTAMHRIVEGSPLWGLSAEEMASGDMEWVISVSGLEETTSQTVHARYSYDSGEIDWDHRFVNVLHLSEAGERTVDYARFHDTEPA